MSDVTIGDLIEESGQFDEGKADYQPSSQNVVFDSLMRMEMPPLLTHEYRGPFRVEDTALRHLCDKLTPGAYPAGTARRLPAWHYRQLVDRMPYLVAQEFNKFVGALPSGRNGEPPQWFVRTHEDGVRAVLSDGYANISNTEMLKMAREAMGGNEASLVRPYVSRDAVIVKSIVTWGPHPLHPNSGESVGLGFVISNNEVGGGSAVVQPVIQFTSCANSIVALRDDEGQELGVRLSHRGNARSKMLIMQQAIVEALPGCWHLLDRYIQANSEALPSIEKTIKAMGQKFGWNEEVQLKVAMGTKGGETLAALADGITYAAHNSELSPEDQLIMEQVGGETLFGRAAKLAEQHAMALAER